MMLFIFSQLLGLFVFLTFNLSLFLFIKYKRNQITNELIGGRVWKFNFSYLLLCLFCLFGISFRTLSLQENWETASTQRTREDQIVINSLVEDKN